MIEGVEIYLLKSFPDSRGRVSHFMRKDTRAFKNFDVQEVYFFSVFPDAIKGWHRHRKMTVNYCFIVGNVKLVLYDDRADSPTAYELQEIYMGESGPYQIVRIPPMVWIGVKAVEGKTAVGVNASDVLHNPQEIEMDRLPPDKFYDEIFPYNWDESNQR